MKNSLLMMKDLLKKADPVKLTETKDIETVYSIEDFFRQFVDCDNQLENNDHVFGRIKDCLDDTETSNEFVRWIHDSVSRPAYLVARDWSRNMAKDKVLVYNTVTCTLESEDEVEKVDLNEFGIDFRGDLPSCVAYVYGILENIINRAEAAK